MRSFRSLISRPALATAAVVAMIAAALLLVPVSYTRTTGYEARLALSGAVPDAANLNRIAAEFGKAMGAENVSATMQDATASHPAAASITARVPVRPRATVERTAAAFARALGKYGVSARAEIRPLVEQALGNLYAYAAERVVEIRIERQGKTDAQVEQEVRDQLIAAGLQNPTVSVKTEGGQTQVQIHAEGHDASTPLPDTHITVDGVSPTNQPLVRVHADHNMSDDEIRAEVERQLRAQGVNAEVTVVNGKITVRRRP